MDSEERQLSDRERTVLLLAAEGLTDKEIAKHLNLSQRTIGTYWERMRQKLGPFSRTQLVARFLRYEGELERSSENYRNLFGAWDEGVWILGSTGKTIYANEPVASLLGRSLQGLLASDASRVLREAVGEEGALFLIRAGSEPQTVEFKVSREDGIHWLRLRGSPMTDRRGEITSVVLLVQDVTFHRHVRNTLDSCELSLSFLAQRSGDLIVRFDGSLRCSFVNDSFARLGISKDSCVGKHLPELGSVFQPITNWISELEKALNTGENGSFHSQWEGLGTLETHYLSEPTLETHPRNVLCITPLPR